MQEVCELVSSRDHAPAVGLFGGFGIRCSVSRATRAGDPWFVGHAHGQRWTLFFVEVRSDANGQPLEIWQLAAEAVRRPALQEVAPLSTRRVEGGANGQRPVSAGPYGW